MTEMEWINSSWYIDGLIEALAATTRMNVPTEEGS